MNHNGVSGFFRESPGTTDAPCFGNVHPGRYIVYTRTSTAALACLGICPRFGRHNGINAPFPFRCASCSAIPTVTDNSLPLRHRIVQSISEPNTGGMREVLVLLLETPTGRSISGLDGHIEVLFVINRSPNSASSVRGRHEMLRGASQGMLA